MRKQFRDYTVYSNKETIQKLLNGEIQGLVATNKLSRGQDIPDVDHVGDVFFR